MRLWILLLTGFPLIVSAAMPCMPAARVPGTPIEAPHAVFEAYVVEVHSPQTSPSTFGELRMRRALVEVIRSFHGPYSPGQQVETITMDGIDACGGAVESGSHVLVASEFGGAFQIVELLPKAQVVPQGPFAALAYATGEPRRGLRRSLKSATLRGKIDASLASALYARARPGRHVRCEIAGDGTYAQVSWGKAFGGNDARSKVIFERANDAWIEILRYEAPTPTPARTRNKRSKSRALWAEESGFRRPGVALADSTS